MGCRPLSWRWFVAMFAVWFAMLVGVIAMESAGVPPGLIFSFLVGLVAARIASSVTGE